MPRKLMVLFWLAMVLPAAIGHSGEKTYEALTNQGLLHFNRAYYMALPQNNPQTAAKEFVLAEKTFQEAIRLAPKRPEAYAHLGQTYFVQDKFTASAEMYEKALDLAPERKDLYLKLASLGGAQWSFEQLRSSEKSRFVKLSNLMWVFLCQATPAFTR